MKELLSSLLKNKKRMFVAILALLFVGYFIYRPFAKSSAQTSYVLGLVQKQTIVASVSGTGQVSQDRSVNLSPTTSGKLAAVFAKQGQTVKAGQVVAVMDQTNTTIALNQAKANLASAQANYDQTMAGATNADVELSQLAVDSAQAALDNANQNLITVTKQQNQAVASAQTNLLNSTLQAMPSNTNLGNGSLTISGTYTGTDQGSYNIKAYDSGSGQQFDVSGLETATSKVNKGAPTALGTKGLYITFSGNIYNNDSWTISIPNLAANSYNSNYVAYQNALTARDNAIASAKNQVANAQNSLKQSQINLQLKTQPPSDQQIQAAKAQLLSAQAALQNAQLAYDNNILKAPFDGVVAALNNRAGDTVSAGANVATVISNQSIAAIPLNEVDVAKVKEGDKATMTFDAVEGLTITGKVVQIDQLGTVNQGVVNYNVKVSFDEEDEKIKPGMSVNVSIITDSKTDVLAVPNSAIKTQNNNSYVLLLDPKNTKAASGQQGVTSSVAPQQVMVQTGISDGSYTEITSGTLKEGDSVVTQSITPSSQSSNNASGTNILRLGGGGAGTVRFNNAVR